ncbi:MAG: hypothetical protein IPH88_05580 [Bacteroidales bacterium]|nr:hypothetical protein [Bacteroidales bacterium]
MSKPKLNTLRLSIPEPSLEWLLDSDVSIQYQVHRDLLQTERSDLKTRILLEGWGANLLALRNENGHWGQGFYQPKWISSHYTLLDLRNLCCDVHPNITSTLLKILKEEKGNDGGINPARTLSQSDVCINGMFLNYASYFRIPETDLHSVVDFILSQLMPDGGFNCRSNRSGARHSSMHTTISVLEGIDEYRRNGYTYRLPELILAEESSREFLLAHKLFRSHRSGNIIDPRMLMLSYPCRWKYDILRALDYFRQAGCSYDSRMDDALEIIIGKQRTDNCWPLQAKHPGQVHFDMEKAGKASRWNTLRALRVLRYFGAE